MNNAVCINALQRVGSFGLSVGGNVIPDIGEQIPRTQCGTARLAETNRSRFVPDRKVRTQNLQQHEHVKRVGSREYGLAKNRPDVAIRPDSPAQPEMHLPRIARSEQNPAVRAEIHRVQVHQRPKSPGLDRFPVVSLQEFRLHKRALFSWLV